MDATTNKVIKKRMGSFYSPSILARYVASKVNKLLSNDSEGISILDPAVGEGELLVEMLNLRPRKLDTYIGVDIDKDALDTTRIRLGDVGGRSFLFHSNALNPKSQPNLNGWDYIKFQSGIKEIDCIISNPPWGAEITIDQNELSNFITAVGQYDIYDLFIEKSLNVLSNGGVYAFIVPDSIFRKEHKPIRQLLLETTSINSIIRIGEFFFEGVNTSVSILIGTKGYTSKNKVQCVHLSNEIAKQIISSNQSIQSVEASYSHTSHQDFFINEDYNFVIDIASEDESLMRHLNSCPKLMSYLKSTRGVELSKKGNVVQCPICHLWQPLPSNTNITTRCAHCKQPFDFNSSIQTSIIGPKENLDNPLPFLRGEDLSRYSYSQKLYIEMGKAGIKYKSIALYEKPKILVRKTGVGITAVLDYRGNIVNQVVYMLDLRTTIISPKISLELFIAILNSRVITYYIIKKYGSTKWCTHPYVSQEMVEMLPIPDFNILTKQDWSIIDRITSIVKEIYDSSSMTPTLEMDLELEKLIIKLFRIDGKDFLHIMETISNVEQLAPFRRLLNIPRSEWDLDI